MPRRYGWKYIQRTAADTKVNPKKFDKLTEVSIDDFIANVVPTATNIEVLRKVDCPIT